MADASLTPDVRRFVVARIHSVPMLEALLLVRSRAEPWPLRELAARLYLAEARVRALVDELCEAGLARVEADLVHYAPDSTELAETVGQLATTYSRHVVAVTELIHSGVERKAHEFADAFRLRRDD